MTDHTPPTPDGRPELASVLREIAELVKPNNPFIGFTLDTHALWISTDGLMLVLESEWEFTLVVCPALQALCEARGWRWSVESRGDGYYYAIVRREKHRPRYGWALNPAHALSIATLAALRATAGGSTHD